ncbi:hypothetical protein Y1Q_0005466 [Alligator mississippiensis]|uniref:Uncharacterized protein n=1 Tax=Alligator mississippiensis TaxID=8496 RepID=A0A151MEK1_ALLMI|nr:hypothetical protein Y1Q_0005466 [Alligator mississippiensis]
MSGAPGPAREAAAGLTWGRAGSGAAPGHLPPEPGPPRGTARLGSAQRGAARAVLSEFPTNGLFALALIC